MGHAKGWIIRAAGFVRSHLPKIAVAALAIFALYGLLGYFVVPPVLRHVATGRLAASLSRPVTVGRIGFNPYRLRLDVDKLHIGEREPSQPFVDIGHLRVKVSWTSLFRLAPVIGAVAIDRPAIHVVRSAPQRFNFSDLISESNQAPADKSRPAPPGKPLRFAVSNIQLNDGEVRFDDAVLGHKHSLEHIQLDVPFIANLPADVDIFVQPLLHMVVDGSPLRITGKVKPFANPPESVVDLNLHRLDLSPYFGYLPVKLAVKIAAGALSSELQVHFVNAAARPIIRVGGEVALDQVDVRDAANAPLVALNHAAVSLTDVEPLENVAHLGKIFIDGLTCHVALNRDGTTNLASLTGGNAAAGAIQSQPHAATTQPTKIATQSTATTAQSAPADVSLESFELADGALTLTDNRGAAPAALAMRGVHFGLKNLRTTGQAPPAAFAGAASLGGGGSIAAKGSLDLAQSQVMADISLDQIDLPALQTFAQPVLAATIGAGKLNAHAKVQTHFASRHFNVHAEPASVSIDNFQLLAPRERESPLGWTRLSASIGQIDLAARQAAVKEVRADGLHLFVRRQRDGELSLATLLRTSAPSSPNRDAKPSSHQRRAVSSSRPRGDTASSAAARSWQYRIASIAVENTDARVEDDTTPRPVALAIAPLNLRLRGVSNDFAKPIALELEATVNRNGNLKVTGTAALTPLKADVRVITRRLDLAVMDPYVSSRLNATIKSAALTMDGKLGVDRARNKLRVSYRGDATIGGVRMLDKVTNDSFLIWNALSASGINFNLGSGRPRVRIEGLALAKFYARVILNRDGHLNLGDITASPQSAPTSLTRAEPAPAARAPSLSAATTEQPIGADIELGQITFQGGHINYTDNFIRPNYRANLTEIAGKVGAFGTRSTAPAEVALQGQINGSAPIDLSGSVNPLAPMAFVDLKAKADGIELTNLTPYSTKYTGYPIVKGTLTVNVHYLLDQQKLTADNHIFIDQLTFGDKVESATATNLPVRLAVSLLKNSRGEIDVDVPVSGSLSDPQFSVGSAVLHAFWNLIVKAATSPFSLLASTFGGGREDFGYVEFAPGWATLTPDSQNKLAALAKALQDRPALRLNISGRIDPRFDREGLREAMLTKSIRAQKIKVLGSKAAGMDSAGVEVTPDEYDKYLERAYKAAKFPKPRNLIGLTKSLPPDEMKKLMLANTEVTDQDLQHLADARANAVRQSLSKNVSPGRLFVTVPKLNADGLKDKGKTSRVDLSLE